MNISAIRHTHWAAQDVDQRRHANCICQQTHMAGSLVMVTDKLRIICTHAMDRMHWLITVWEAQDRLNEPTMIEVDFGVPFCSGSVDIALMASVEVGLAQGILCLQRDLRCWCPSRIKLQKSTQSHRVQGV
jgi:hypothetical protein